jgi:hypothetical protein
MLGAPASLTTFNLSLEDDCDSGDHSASEFQLFAGGKLVDDVRIWPRRHTYRRVSYQGEMDK